jgi:hypothetical protein
MFIVLNACRSSTAPTEIVEVTVASSKLLIMNNTTRDLYYAVFERTSLATINWAAICRSDNLIKVRETKELAITDSSFLPSNEAVIYWWHQGQKYENADYYGPDEVRTIVQKIR